MTHSLKHPLWPDTQSLAESDGVAAHHYLVVPSPDDPRLVVPTRPPKAAGEIILALRGRSSSRARVQNMLLRLAGRINVRTALLPDPPLFGVVASALGGYVQGHQRHQYQRKQYVIGVHLGPPRANRKPVLAVADRSGELLAFAKCGVDPLTDELVRHEAEALSHLKDLTVTQVPELIASGDHDGHPYVLQTPVPTRPHRRDSEVVAAAQLEVALSGQSRVDVDAALDATQERWTARRSSCDDQTVTHFATIARSWCDQVRDAAIRWGSWHGDWRITNMSVTARGCSVWDWERYATGVPVGYDALHLFLTSRASSVNDLTTLPADVRDNAAHLLRPFEVVDRADVELVTTGYFLELAGRYLDDNQARKGARLGAVGQWLLPHLQSSANSSNRPHQNRTTPGVADN